MAQQLVTDPAILKAWEEFTTPPPPSEELIPLEVETTQPDFITDPELLETWKTQVPGAIPIGQPVLDQREDEPSFFGDLWRSIWSGFVASVEGDVKIADMLMGGTTATGAALQSLEAHKERLFKDLTPEMQKSMSKEFFSEDESGNNSFGDAWTDPRAVISTISHGIGSLGAMVLTGGPLKWIAKKGLKRAFLWNAEGLVKKGFSRQAAERIAMNRLDSVSGIIGYGAAETLIVTGQVGKQIEDEVMDMPAEILDQAEIFQETLSQVQEGLPHLGPNEQYAYARKLVARQLGIEGAKNVALPSFILGAIAGNWINKALTGRLDGNMMARTMKVLAAEMPTEFSQGAAEQIVQNIEAKKLDKARRLFQNVLDQATREGLGALGAAPILGALPGQVSEKAAKKHEKKVESEVPEEPPLRGTKEDTEEAPAQQKVRLRKAAQKWRKELPGLPRGLHKALAEVPSDELGADAKGQLQELRKLVFEAGQDYETAVRTLWGEDLANAPPGLRNALVSGLDLQDMSPEAPQREAAPEEGIEAGPAEIPAVEPLVEPEEAPPAAPEEVSAPVEIIAIEPLAPQEPAKAPKAKKPKKAEISAVTAPVVELSPPKPEVAPQEEVPPPVMPGEHVPAEIAEAEVETAKVEAEVQQAERRVTEAERRVAQEPFLEERREGPRRQEVRKFAEPVIGILPSILAPEEDLQREQARQELVREATKLVKTDQLPEGFTVREFLSGERRGEFSVFDASLVQIGPPIETSSGAIRSGLDVIRQNQQAAIQTKRQEEIRLPEESEKAAEIEEAAAETETAPSESQKEAGTYKKGKVRLHGMEISIETAKGEERTGPGWKVTLPHHYGYIRRTVGADGEQIDIHLGPEAERVDLPVFVIDQTKPDSEAFDESKIMLGFADETAARKGYMDSFEGNFGKKVFGAITPMSLDQFKIWLDKPGARRKAVSELKEVKETLPEPTEEETEPKPSLVQEPVYQTYTKEQLEQLPKLPLSKQKASYPLVAKTLRRSDANEETVSKSKGIIADINRLVSRAQGQPAMVANAIASDINIRSGSEIIGKTVRSAHDVATLTQMYRDPRWETLRYIFVRGDEIVGHTGVTQRLPSGVKAFPAEVSSAPYTWLHELMKGHGADGFYMVHNHPSGSAVPSDPDIAITEAVASEFKDQFKAHVVIDSNNYATISASGETAVFQKEFGPDKLMTASVPHPVLGRKVMEAIDVAAVAKDVQSPKGWITLVGVTGKIGKVRAIQEVPEHLVESGAMEQVVRDFQLNTGSSMILVGQASAKYAAEYRSLNVRDAVHAEGYSLFERIPGKSPLVVETDVVEQEKPDYDPELTNLLEKIGKPPQGFWHKMRSLLAPNWRQHLTQGMMDGFHALKLAEQEAGIEDHDDSSYIAARMSTTTDAQLWVALMKGPLKWMGNVATFIPNSKGLMEILQPVEDQIELFQAYMAARRADRLYEEGRERLLTEDNIKRGLALAREYPIFEEVAAEWDTFNDHMVDFAVDADLIDPEAAELWKAQGDYVPFFRLMDGRSPGQRSARGLANQQGPKKLVGGESRLNDIVENMLMNTAYLIEGSMKNHAAKMAVENLAGTGYIGKAPLQWRPAIVPMSEVRKIALDLNLDVASVDKKVWSQLQKMWSMVRPMRKDIIRIMIQGKPQYFEVYDEHLLRALTSINQEAFGRWMDIFRKPKRWLTMMVTADPAFQAANFLRDTLHAFVISRDHITPIVSGLTGAKKALTRDESFWEMIAAGGGFHAGFISSHDPSASVRIMQKEMRHANFQKTVLSEPRKVWDAWIQFGSAIENANRLAVYDGAIKAGKSHLVAAFEAKDFMDFSLRGDHMIMRFLTESVPFLNARIQGIYRLGRGFKENPGSFTARGTLIALAGLALWAINKDDERYRDLEEWDKDAYWHFWLGEDHYRFPKPFEVGFIFGTIPERIFGSFYEDPDATEASKRILDRLLWNIREIFSVGFPQTIDPIIEQIANVDFFTQRPIVSRGKEKLRPEAQFNQWTHETSIQIGRATGLSPARVDHLIRAYFGTLGDYVLSVSDYLTGALWDYPNPPSLRIDDYAVIKRFKRAEPPRGTRYTREFYELMLEMERTYNTVVMYSQFSPERAKELLAAEKEAVRPLRLMKRANKTIQAFNRRMTQIHMSTKLSPADKRKQIDELIVKKSALYKKAVQRANQ